MTTTPDTAPPASAPETDPRIGQLLDLVQGLINGYGALAMTFAKNIPSPEIRRELMDQAQRDVEDARRRYTDIVISRRLG